MEFFSIIGVAFVLAVMVSGIWYFLHREDRPKDKGVPEDRGGESK